MKTIQNEDVLTRKSLRPRIAILHHRRMPCTKHICRTENILTKLVVFGELQEGKEETSRQINSFNILPSAWTVAAMDRPHWRAMLHTERDIDTDKHLTRTRLRHHNQGSVEGIVSRDRRQPHNYE